MQQVAIQWKREFHRSGAGPAGSRGLLAMAALALLAGTIPAMDVPAGRLTFACPPGWTAQTSNGAWMLSPAEQEKFLLLVGGEVEDSGATLDQMMEKNWRFVIHQAGLTETSHDSPVQGATAGGLAFSILSRTCQDKAGHALIQSVLVIADGPRFYPLYITAADAGALKQYLPAALTMVRDVRSPDTPAAPAAPPAPAVSVYQGGIVGNWGTLDYHGELVNPSTGAFVQDSSTGTWYEFHADGTFRFIMIARGMIISGGIINSGQWQLNGNHLTLHVTHEVWRPYGRGLPPYDRQADRYEQFEVQMKPGPELRLRDLSKGDWGDPMHLTR
jgi:hypothetical protein